MVPPAPAPEPQAGRGERRRASPAGAAPAAGLETLDPPQQSLSRRVQLGLGGAQQRDLDGEAGLVALAHGGERAGQLVDRSQQGRWADRRGLSPQAVRIGGAEDEGIGNLADGLHHQEVAQVAEHVARELCRIASRVRQPLDPLQYGLGILGGDRVDDLEELVGPADPENREHPVHVDVGAAVGDELVERSEGVAEASLGGAGDQGDGAVVDLDALRDGHATDDLRDLVEPRAGEIKALAAVRDRRHHLVGFGGRQHEDRVGRRLLEGLEEGVPRLLGQHVRLVEDVDLPAAGRGRVGNALAQVADVVDRPVRGSVHLDHVHRRARRDRHAGLALPAGRDRGATLLAIERAGENLRHRRLPGPTRPDEQVGVMNLVLLDRIAQGADHVLLPDDLVEGPWAVAAVEGR